MNVNKEMPGNFFQSNITGVVLFVLILLPILLVRSQDNFIPDYLTPHRDYIPVTPNAAPFVKSGDVAVDLSSGVPQISIPIYTVVEDGVSIPITLNYDASGIKVSDLSGPVGMKWSLSVGGGVYREVRDKPDEHGWLTNYKGFVDTQWIQDQQQEISDYDLQVELDNYTTIYDYYPDNFDYNFLGNKGTFIFDHEGNIKKEYNDGLLIGLTGSPNNQMGFQIQDLNNTRYYFNKYLESNFSNTLSFDNYNPPVGYSKDTALTGWMLNKIATKNNKLINFEYLNYQFEYQLDKVTQSIRIVDKCANANFSCGCEGEVSLAENPLNSPPRGKDAIETSISVRRRPLNQLPSKISTSSVEVSFNYDNDPNASDWKRRLTSIFIKNLSNDETREFVFTYSRYSGDPRLRLDSLQEIGVDGTVKPPHIFTYKNGGLPDKSATSKDFYGYNNGQSNSTIIPFTDFAHFSLAFEANMRDKLGDRSPNLSHLSSGTLERIQYPTGGFTDFTYELNEVDVVGGGTQQSTYTTTNVYVSNQAAQGESWVDGQYTVFNTLFTLEHDASVNYDTFSSYCAYDRDRPNIDCSRWSIGTYIPPTPNGIQATIYGNSILERVIGSEGSVTLAAGFYYVRVRVKTSNLNLPGNPRDQVHLVYEKLDNSKIYAGGLRIKNTKDFTKLNKEARSTSYEYEGLEGHIFNTSLTYKSKETQLIFSSDEINSISDYNKGGYYYKKVIKKQLFKDSIIKTVFNFDRYFKNKVITSQKKSEEYYKNDHLVKHVSYDYERSNVSTLYYSVMSNKDYCYYNFFPDFGGNGANGTVGFNNPYYFGYAGPENRFWSTFKNNLRSVTSTDVLVSDNLNFSAVVNVENYEYNEIKQIKKKVSDGRYSVDSEEDIFSQDFNILNDGDVTEIQYEYVDDFIGNSTLNTLKDRNLKNIPVSQKSFVNGELYQGIFNKFNDSGDVVEIFSFVDGGSFSEDRPNYVSSEYQSEVKYNYDSGKVVEIIPKSGLHRTLVWGNSLYNQNFLLAEIVNLDRSSYLQAQTLNQSSNINVGINFDDPQEILIDFFNGLRVLFPESQISSYTYDLFDGITSKTDPRGNTAYYEYDDLSRLKFVKDYDGNILSKSEYNFRTNN